tara:strand:+ start:487 stop:735 length:249 start_codon:yes stop_codon:yes gene_type:complete
MSLVEVTNTTDKVEIVGVHKHVQVRSATWVEKDGAMIGSKQYHRTVFAPNDSSDNDEVQAIINIVHTDAVIAAYNESLETGE